MALAEWFKKHYNRHDSLYDGISKRRKERLERRERLMEEYKLNSFNNEV